MNGIPHVCPVIDREAMGSAESEPQITAALRSIVMEQEPDIWSLITQDDPVLKQ